MQCRTFRIAQKLCIYSNFRNNKIELQVRNWRNSSAEWGGWWTPMPYLPSLHRWSRLPVNSGRSPLRTVQLAGTPPPGKRQQRLPALPSLRYCQPDVGIPTVVFGISLLGKPSLLLDTSFFGFLTPSTRFYLSAVWYSALRPLFSAFRPSSSAFRFFRQTVSHLWHSLFRFVYRVFWSSALRPLFSAFRPSSSTFRGSANRLSSMALRSLGVSLWIQCILLFGTPYIRHFVARSLGIWLHPLPSIFRQSGIRHSVNCFSAFRPSPSAFRFSANRLTSLTLRSLGLSLCLQ